MNPKFKKILFYGKAYRRLELMNRAASLSFYTMISIFPTIVVTLIISSTVFNPNMLHTEVQQFIERALPFESDLILQNLNAVFNHKLKLSSWSIFMLFISAQMLFVNMERIINSILHTERKRNFFITRLFFFVWLLAMLTVVFAPVLVSLSANALKAFRLPMQNWATISGHVGFFLSSVLMFLVILSMLPTRKINRKRLFKGALGFALTVQLGKLLFKTIMTRNLSRYNFVYGSLSSTMLVMMWIFYFYNVFLFFVYWAGREHDPLFIFEQKPTST